ncbi:hypothetical protein BAUCODRAFT_35464 [Baudoinia panamericana UAMH 10762]|uniref:Uncharacterized protein n=1 Tax=Baudoinia panamericana (strain UAMH 10762) TaxID=717646 RepID=M2MFR8_BAUPA|nr:uncharacterized protein BAUCODRAFT_35464 [Baudoinia panamericana UAMH 10762]EMC95481.1 hypothetical protein BAUCODRAFT_35464 [Baudoinia panamericana UAMH 10762]
MAAQDFLTITRLGWAVAIILIGLVVRFFQRLHYHRTLVKGLPGPPHSYLWGSLISMNETLRTQPKRAAPQTFATILKEKYDLPDCFYLDLWPFGPMTMMIMDADVMGQVTVKQSFPKAVEVGTFMRTVSGPGDLVASEGATWKKWRATFNPGFAANHLISLVPLMVDQCLVFCDVLTKRAGNNDLFRMESDTTRLTVDIIGKIVLDADLNSQRAPNPLVDALMQQIRLVGTGAIFNPIEAIDWPYRWARQAYNKWIMDRYIGARLEERWATREARGKSRTVIDLAMDTYVKENKASDSGAANNKRLDSEFKQAAISNMKTFIFAGHDTTSSTICYCYYYLSKDPARLAKIRAEHDTVFGPDPDAVADQLRHDGHLLNKLEYTLAVIREVLRLQPPASTLRTGPPGSFATDPTTGQRLPTEHFMMWCVDVGLHRNPKYWDSPHVFRPERFLKDDSKSDTSANFTSNPAWVGFSKGPRNCIGQELAVLETKVILAMTLRKFEFQAAFDELVKLRGDGSGYPSDFEGIQTQFGEEAYQIQMGAAKPREGMPCRIRLIR